ncbi:hypothetical protein DAMA08_038930 [Martiniozyma asiatica (nom. inval.)]|nr:hypothetical protein DAMA08_038930 [Martiniozyma asiatica]
MMNPINHEVKEPTWKSNSWWKKNIYIVLTIVYYSYPFYCFTRAEYFVTFIFIFVLLSLIGVGTWNYILPLYVYLNYAIVWIYNVLLQLKDSYLEKSVLEI